MDRPVEVHSRYVHTLDGLWETTAAVSNTAGAKRPGVDAWPLPSPPYFQYRQTP
jgi:hypothetical protein